MMSIDQLKQFAGTSNLSLFDCWLIIVVALLQKTVGHYQARQLNAKIEDSSLGHLVGRHARNRADRWINSIIDLSDHSTYETEQETATD